MQIKITNLVIKYYFTFFVSIIKICDWKASYENEKKLEEQEFLR